VRGAGVPRVARRKKSDEELLRELTAQPDGLPARYIGAWTLKKLAVLLLYFEPFTRLCHGGYYIDGLAGPGMCEVKESPSPARLVWGSPLLALRTQPGFERSFFVEIDGSSAEALSARTRQSANRCEVRVGDANLLVPRIVRSDVPLGAPCFCFLDPEASEVYWSTISQVAHCPGRKRMPELLINFPLEMASQRLLTTEEPMDRASVEKLDRFFPSRNWREVYDARRSAAITPPEAKEQYLDIYKAGLLELGYDEDGVHTLPVKTPGQPGGKGRELYHLIFASDHSAGKKIMKHVLERQNWLDHLVMGQLALLPEA